MNAPPLKFSIHMPSCLSAARAHMRERATPALSGNRFPRGASDTAMRRGRNKSREDSPRCLSVCSESLPPQQSISHQVLLLRITSKHWHARPRRGNVARSGRAPKAALTVPACGQMAAYCSLRTQFHLCNTLCTTARDAVNSRCVDNCITGGYALPSALRSAVLRLTLWRARRAKKCHSQRT